MFVLFLEFKSFQILETWIIISIFLEVCGFGQLSLKNYQVSINVPFTVKNGKMPLQKIFMFPLNEPYPTGKMQKNLQSNCYK